MELPEKEVHVTAQDASGGVKNNGVRYVLAISLGLVIVALIVVYLLRSGHA